MLICVSWRQSEPSIKQEGASLFRQLSSAPEGDRPGWNADVNIISTSCFVTHCHHFHRSYRFTEMVPASASPSTRPPHQRSTTEWLYRGRSWMDVCVTWHNTQRRLFYIKLRWWTQCHPSLFRINGRDEMSCLSGNMPRRRWLPLRWEGRKALSRSSVRHCNMCWQVYCRVPSLNEPQLPWQVLIVGRAMPKEVYHTKGGGGGILRTSRRINFGCWYDSEGRRCSNGGTECGGGETSQKYVSGGTALFEILALKPQMIKWA